MRQSTVWVLLLAVVLTAHGGFTLASTLALEDKVAHLEAVIEMQGDASSDLHSCTQVLSQAVRRAEQKTAPEAKLTPLGTSGPLLATRH